MKYMLILISLILAEDFYSQGVTPGDWGLKAFQIHDPELGQINFYITENGIDQDKPVLFIISGSKGLPTLLVVRSGDKSIQLGTIPPDQINSFSDQFHVAFIGKPGTPFSDTLFTDEINPIQNLEDYQPSVEYIQKCGMEWEVKASSLVIDTLCSILPSTGDKVVAMGFSEGGRLVVRLAAANKRITHLVSVISGGLNQFYSSIINRRIDAASGAMTHAEAQEAVDSLFAIYKEIYNHPKNTDKWYYGHPYKRWGSFCTDIPLEHLVKLDIPILFVNGSADRSTPILQADYVMLEFIRLGKTNLTYHVIPGANHWFYEVVIEDGKEKPVSHRKEAFNIISGWINPGNSPTE